MRWIADRSGAVFTAVLLACLAGSGCVLDWEEGDPCGNGRLDPGEECDNAGGTARDGCSASCTVDHGWTCTGDPSHCTATCGDGFIALGAEECDQDVMPPTGGDGCSSTCQIESGWNCSDEPSLCMLDI